jgi:hypothetical protein
MKHSLAILLLIALAGCATAPPTPTGTQITVKPERIAQCKAAGGCALVTMEELQTLARAAFDAGAEEAQRIAAQALDSHGCRRGDT